MYLVLAEVARAGGRGDGGLLGDRSGDLTAGSGPAGYRKHRRDRGGQ